MERPPMQWRHWDDLVQQKLPRPGIQWEIMGIYGGLMDFNGI